MKKISIAAITQVGFVMALLFSGCETLLNSPSDFGSVFGSERGILELRLHDLPIDSADAVNVFIERIEINNASDTTAWTVFSEPQASYNLLELTNGAYEVIGDSTVEPGFYPQIRLILSPTDHQIVFGTRSYAMKVPSGWQTGLKVNINAKVEADIKYVAMLDFDVARSVVKRGNSKAAPYLLKPVIRASNLATSGSIGGGISPAKSHAMAHAISGSDTVTTTVADTTSGYFKLIGLDEGSYTVSIEPRNVAYQDTSITDVHVAIGETNDIGTVQLTEI